MVQVLSNENELAHPLLVLAPLLREVAAKDHVHRVVHELLLAVRHGEHALHPVDVRALLAQQLHDVRLDLLEVHRALLHDTAAGHRVVVLVLALRVQELRVHLQGLVQVEPPNVQHTVWGNLRLGAPHDGGVRVDGLEPLLDPHQVRLLHQVGLVQQHPVREGDLLHGLVLGALWLLRVQVLLDVLGVHEGDDAVEPGELLDLLLHEEGLGHGGGVRQAGGLDDDAVELEVPAVHALLEPLQDDDEVLAHRTADAPVHHLDDLLLGLELGVLLQQGIIDADLAELVLDDRQLLAVLLREDVVQKGGLAGAQKPGQDGHRDARVGVLLGCNHRLCVSLRWRGGSSQKDERTIVGAAARFLDHVSPQIVFLGWGGG